MDRPASPRVGTGRYYVAGRGNAVVSRYSCNLRWVDGYKRRYHRTPPLYPQLLTQILYFKISTTLSKLRRATMPAASKFMKPSKASLDMLPNSQSSQTPPSSPSQSYSCQCHLEPPVALHLAQLFKEVIKATQATSDPATAPLAAETQDLSNAQPEEARARASRLEFKTVDEVYVPGEVQV